VTLASQFSDLRNDALQEGMTLAMKIQDNEQRAEAFTPELCTALVFRAPVSLG
jgi:hypothetical protein